MKYNLSEIMKRAWEVVRVAKTSFAAALKFSWACAKKANELKTKGIFKHLDGTVSFRIWANYGKVRAYYRCSWYSKYANSSCYNFVEMQEG